MKKLLSVLSLVVALFLVTACGEKTTTTSGTTTTTTTAATTTTQPVKPTLPEVEVTLPAEGKLKLGMGIVVSLDSSKTGQGQVDVTIVSVVYNHEGKILAAKLDACQNIAKIGEAIEVTRLQTKQELKEAYGMAGKVDNNGDGIKLEWYLQAEAYEAYLVGKTVTDVKAFDLQYVNNHWISTDNALLEAGCTIQVSDFNKATLLALADDQAFEFDAVENFTLGLAAVNYDNGSTAATDAADGSLQLYSDFATSVVVDGRIVASLNDAIQPKIDFDVDGNIVSKTFVASKRVLKEAYGMAGKVDNNGDGIKLEWYIQSAAFSQYVVGKTAAEVLALETQLVNNHHISTDSALLEAGCTIQITGIKEVVAKSVNNAK